jgi:hypothetical protein
MFNKTLAFAAAFVAMCCASSISAQAGAPRDLSVEFSQAAQSLVGRDQIVEKGAYFYSGTDRSGGPCQAIVRYSPTRLQVDVLLPQNRIQPPVQAWLEPSFDDIADLELNSNRQWIGWTVRRADMSSVTLHAEIQDEAPASERLVSVALARASPGMTDAVECHALHPMN